jgi:ribosomal protein L29
MFAACSGPCELCDGFGGCLAGHGDDHYRRLSDSKLRKRLDHLRAELLRAYQVAAGGVVEAPLPADVATLRRNIARIEEELG